MSRLKIEGLNVVDLRQKIDALNKEAHQMQREQPVLCLEKARKAEKLAHHPLFGDRPYVKGVIASQTHQANAQLMLGHFADGLRLAIDANALANIEADIAGQIISLGATAYAYFRMTNYTKAQALFQQQLLLATQLDHIHGKIEANNGLSAVFGESENFQLAAGHAEASFQLIKGTAVLEKIYLTQCCNNLSVLYGYTNQFDLSLAYGLQGLEAIENEASLPALSLLLSVATTYRYKKRFDKALEYYDIARQRLEGAPNPYVSSVAFYDIGKTYFEMGEFTLAQQNIEQSVGFAEQYENHWQGAQCYELLSKLAQQRGQFEEALAHHQKFHELQREAIGKDKSEQMRQLRASYEIEIAQKEASLLRQQAQELEQQVKQRTNALEMALNRERVLGNELETALKQSQRANEFRSRIIETVSHEFRTPLAIINTAADLLTIHYKRLSDAKRDGLQKRISESVFFLTKLIEDMMLVESVDSKSLQIQLRGLPFGELCNRLEQRLIKTAVLQERVQFVCEQNLNAIIVTDEELVRQILEHLLSNAIKFSKPETTVQIKAIVLQRQMKFSITNQGIGIATDELETIFDLLVRGSNVETRRGVGIGLYLARLLTELLDGTLVAHSDGEGFGATFTLRLPI